MTNRGKGSEGSGSGSSGSGGGGSGSGSGGGARKREPRIGRRTIPPPDTTAGSPGSKPTGKTRAGTGGQAKSTPPASLRSAGASSSQAKPARPRPSTGSQRPKAAAPARRQGGMMAAFRAPSIYPKLGETFGAAARAVLRSTTLVLGAMVLVLALWFAFLGLGLDHVPSYFQLLLALPPLSSFFDLNLAFSITGLNYGWLALVLAITVVRASIFAVITSLVVERLDSGRASMAGVRRGLRCVPAFVGIYFVNVALIFAPQLFQAILGSLFGGLLFFAALVGGVHFLSFAPIIVVRDGSPARTALGTSVRAARLPGSRHVGMVLLYFTLAFLAPAFVPASSAFTINPSIGTWAMVLAVSVFNFVVIAGFAYRFGVIEEDVPPPAPRRERQRTPLFGARR